MTDTEVVIEYDCGYTIITPVPLKSTQTLLANAALGDFISGIADEQHDAKCEVCNG